MPDESKPAPERTESESVPLKALTAEQSGALQKHDTVETAGDRMRERDASAWPVSEDCKLVGMIDAENPDWKVGGRGHDPKAAQVGEIMKRELIFCYEDEVYDASPYRSICGVVATGPMTAAMDCWHRRLPTREKYPLPPSEITGVVLEKAGVPANSAETSAAALISHFAYGGAAGGLYGVIPDRKLCSPFTSGLALGIFVWSLSYLGLLPVLHILRPAMEHPMRRNGLMLGAHLIWGVCLCELRRLLLGNFQKSH